MDAQLHSVKFRYLVERICETMGKPITDALFETWWGALKSENFDRVKTDIEKFLAGAKDDTKFPRPGQFRTPEGPVVQGNPIRDYWRSIIVDEVARQLGHTTATLEPHIVANPDSLGRAMLDALNDFDGQNQLNERSHGMHLACRRMCEDIARAWPRLAKPDSPVHRMTA